MGLPIRIPGFVQRSGRKARAEPGFLVSGRRVRPAFEPRSPRCASRGRFDAMPDVSCAGLIGLDEPALRSRLGPPASARTAGGDRWLVWRSGRLHLRVRLRDRAAASWTAGFAPGYASLREAAAAVGMWPAAAPDARAAAVSEPLVRRAVPDGAGGSHTLTASLRGGAFTAITVFDEPPEW